MTGLCYDVIDLPVGASFKFSVLKMRRFTLGGRKKKNFGSGQLIFENWSVLFLNHNINLPNLIFQQVLKLEIQIKPVSCHVEKVD